MIVPLNGPWYLLRLTSASARSDPSRRRHADRAAVAAIGRHKGARGPARCLCDCFAPPREVGHAVSSSASLIVGEQPHSSRYRIVEATQDAQDSRG